MAEEKRKMEVKRNGNFRICANVERKTQGKEEEKVSKLNEMMEEERRKSC